MNVFMSHRVILFIKTPLWRPRAAAMIHELAEYHTIDIDISGVSKMSQTANLPIVPRTKAAQVFMFSLMIKRSNLSFVLQRRCHLIRTIHFVQYNTKFLQLFVGISPLVV